MRKIYSLLLAFVLFGTAQINAQVVNITGAANTTPNMLATYPSMAAAITDVNNRTAISGPVTLTLASATIPAPAGGFVISTLPAITGSSNTNRFIFDGGGNTITAGVGVSTTNDAIFKITGSDFITIRNFVLNEDALNITNTTRLEWGIGVFYQTGGATNGARGITIQSNTITLNRTNINTFGIYSNSTHTAAAPTSSAPATTTNGGNHDLKIYSNTISNVNMGIVVIGTTAIADVNTGLEIGGATFGNTITNYGTSNAISSYVNVSGTVNGILIKNCNGFVISNNTVTSSVGGVTAGTLNGIQVANSSSTPTATFTNNVNSNTISLQSAVATGAMNGITYPSGSASTTSVLNVNSNNFATFGHTVAASGTIFFINVASTNLTTSISSNTFTNISLNTTGSVTFIAQSFTAPASGTKAANSNSIVTAFAKTGAGGTVTLIVDNGSTTITSTSNCQNNNFSNITLTGATALIGISYTDGGTAPSRTVSGNTLNNWTTGAATITAMNFPYWSGSTSSLSTNTVTNITGQGAITGISIGASVNTATSATIASNIVTNLTSTGTGGAVIGIGCTNNSPLININNNTISTLASTGASAVIGITITGATTTNVLRNTICDISGSNASSTVSGISVSAGTTVTLTNNRIADLRTTAANAANPLNGINITGGTTVNAYYNSVFLNATSSGALFGSSAISVSTTPTVALNNNVFVNNSTSAGAGLTVGYRRSTNALGTYAGTSDRNDFFAINLFTDGATTITALATYKTFVSARDANSISENPPFLSTTCGNANFLKVSIVTPTGLESGGATVGGVTDDFEGDIRNVSTPDIGADEFTGVVLPLCMGTPAASTINGAASVCNGLGTTLSLSSTYTDIGITYQWSSGTTPGGPYGTILGTAATQASGPLTADTYYQCVITCTNSGLSYTTVEKSVLVNALPVVTATPSTASYCTPGGTAVSIAADGALTYAWSPAGGLTAVTGTPVSATPSTTTTYTVTGTDINGCVNTATSAITVAVTPQDVTALATPSTICSADISNLTSSGYVPNSASLPNAYSFTGSTGTYSTISGIGVSFSDVDDASTGNLPIGFTFNYNGVAQTVFAASTNGLIILGQTTNGAGLSANALASTANILAPLWEDNNITGGTVQYTTTGAVGSRVLTVQWTGLHVGASGGASQPTINMQAKLYETTGKIQFIYGTTSGALTSTSASIGISGASGNYISVTPTSPTIAPYATTNIAAENTSISSAANFPTGMTYTFAAPSLALSYSWTDVTNLVSPSTQNTATIGLSATETFTVVVSNGGCAAADVTATVTVSDGALITDEPDATAKCVGETAIFNVTATGAGLTYAWSLDGNPLVDGGNISGALSATLTITNVSALDAGNYRVEVSSTCGSPVNSEEAALTVNALPADVTGAGAGTFCTSTTITAANGNDGTIYFQGTTSNGTSTATASMSEVVTASGTYYFRAQSVDGCWGNQGSVVVVIQTDPVITGTPASICADASGTIAAVAANGCVVLTNSGTTFNGTWVSATDPIALRPATSSNSAICSFDPTNTRNYVVTNFQVSVAGNYTFTMNDNAGYDGMGYIVQGAFVPGNCGGGGTFIKGDDDGGVGDEPLLTATLATGVTYTMISTTFGTTGTFSGSFVWTITPPGGGQIMLPTVGNIEWYTTASGGSAFGSGSPFNPVPGGLTNTSTPGTTTFYAACSNASTCRTAVNFVINANYTVTASSGANGTVTPAGVTTLSCEGTGDQTYTITPDGGYLISDLIVDGVSNTALTTGTYALGGTYDFTDVAANHTISATFTLAACINNTFSGTGNWTDNASWSCGLPPASGDNVTIAAGANATLNTDFTVNGSLVMTATSTLTVNPTNTLTVNGTADFAGQSVTFLSDGTGTASLGQVSGTLTGATNVTVERYIPNNGFRSWRLLSVPTTTSQTIRQAWQEGVANPFPQQNTIPNRGTQITGVFATQALAAAAGFDSTSVQAGMLRWNGASWSNITSTNQSINNFSSYFLYIRGERSKTVTGAVTNTSATTLRTIGTVFTGDQTTNVGASAFALVPNLYPSAILFTGLARTGGVNNLFYIWDSKKLNGNSLGVYQTFSNTNSFNCLISGGSYVLAQPNTIIESGQSFFVTSGAAGTIKLQESAKTSGTNGSLGFRPSGIKRKIDTRLYNGLEEMLDANTVVFDAAYSKAVSDEDAPKLGNPGANFAIETDSKLLAIAGTTPVSENDAVQFRMWNLAKGNYTLEFATNNLNLPEGVTAILEDSYLGSSTAISLSEATKVTFTVDASAGSSKATRFRIVFAKAKPVVTKQSFSIAPNPIENGTMNLVFSNQATGKYSVRLLAAGGQSVMVKTIAHAGGNATQVINLPATMGRGTYTVEITAPDRSRTTQTVLVNRK